MHPRQNVTMDRYLEVMVTLSECVNRLKRAPWQRLTMTSYPVGNKTSLSRKPCITDKKFYGTLSGSHGCSYKIRHGKLPETPLAED